MLTDKLSYLNLDESLVHLYLDVLGWEPEYIEVCAEKIVATVDWRAQIGFPLVSADHPDIRDELESGKAFVFGRSRTGMAVFNIFLEKENSWNVNANMKSLLYNIERAIRESQSRGNSQIVCLLDCTGLTFFNMPTFQLLGQVCHCMQMYSLDHSLTFL